MRETDLYAPIKSFLETQGYEVKAEVAAADVVACRVGEDPLIVELKTSFSLALIYQGIERQKITDAVYIAAPRKTGKAFHASLKSMKTLCRRLGLEHLPLLVGDRAQLLQQAVVRGRDVVELDAGGRFARRQVHLGPEVGQLRVHVERRDVIGPSPAHVTELVHHGRYALEAGHATKLLLGVLGRLVGRPVPVSRRAWVSGSTLGLGCGGSRSS